ncbi:MAG: CcoQ/FixQ family Cbb3-type cytochrome c oxidase assembly chaperone [Verrucomicrobiota bacterium]
MIKNVLTSIGGVENYGIISILIFFAFFVGVILWAFSRRKDYLQSMSTLPLEGGERSRTQQPRNPLE